MTQPLLGSDQDTPDQEAVAALRRRLAGLSAEEGLGVLRALVRGQATDILARPVEDDSNFMELGITSLQALQLNRAVMDATGTEIPLVAIIEHSTPARLAEYVAGTLADEPAA
jgi:acyl carrier protein